MNDISIFLFLLLVTTLFIVLYLFIRFVLSEKRSFTFEIISIPLGIFKFDKRDEYIKNKKKKSVESIGKIETENDENNLKETDISEAKLSETNLDECIGVTDEITFVKNEDELLLENNSVSHESVSIPEQEIKQEESSIGEESDSVNDDNVSDIIAEKETKISDYNKDILEEYNEEDDEDIVYWTASGKAYHTSKKCRTLSRSKVIFNGTMEDSGRYVKCIHCNK